MEDHRLNLLKEAGYQIPNTLEERADVLKKFAENVDIPEDFIKFALYMSTTLVPSTMLSKPPIKKFRNDIRYDHISIYIYIYNMHDNCMQYINTYNKELHTKTKTHTLHIHLL